VLVGPGGFDQKPTGVVIAGLDDVTAVSLIAGGVFGGDDPQPRAEFQRMRQAGEVADLGDQPERGAGRDPAKAGQDLDGLGPAYAASDLLQVVVERVELAVEPSRCRSISDSALWASWSSSRWRAIHARCIVHWLRPSR
jgi:hypothetical protein